MGWWALPDGCCLGLTACFEAEEGFVFRLPWVHPNAGVLVKGWIVAVLIVVDYGSDGFWGHGFPVRWLEVSSTNSRRGSTSARPLAWTGGGGLFPL